MELILIDYEKGEEDQIIGSYPVSEPAIAEIAAKEFIQQDPEHHYAIMIPNKSIKQ